MSNALLRRNSSKQGLQNLMRLTAQRSIEDAEEVERERRRRTRESLSRRNSSSSPGELLQDNETPTEESMYDSSLKPRGPLSLEEDEGFSDWTQRREKRRQQRLQELGQGGEEDEDEEYAKASRGKTIQTIQTSVTSSGRLQQEAERARMEEERRKVQEEEQEAAARAERARREKEREEEEEEQRKREEVLIRRREEVQRQNPDVEQRSKIRVSYTSKVFLNQEPKHANGDAREEEVASHIKSKAKITSRGAEQREAEAILEAEQRLEKIRRSLQEKESHEMEQLKHRQAEAEQDLEELQRRREMRRRVREEEERRKEEEEQQRLAKEEEERRRMREEIERRRMDAAERRKSLSSSSQDGEEAFSPISPKTPTHKITERTESLNRSLKKSNSFKKTQPFVVTAKIDDKMEQYAHAVENSQEARAVKASPSDLPSSLELVTSKKTLFEAGEAWSVSSPTKGPAKDTEGLKVGVAGLITQWVKGPSDSSRQSLSRPADLKPGDVMQKKNMWEIITESPGGPGQSTKGSAGSKKYKFVVTGHGKYEKVFVDEDGGTFTNGKSDFCNGSC